MQTDDGLVVLARQGDMDAFAALVRRHQDPVYRALYRLVSSEQDAQDLAQEVFLRVYRSLDSFTGAAAFATWLHRITRNAATDWLRARRRQLPAMPWPGPAESDSAAAREPPSPEGSAEDSVLRRAQAFALRQALERLPPDARQVLLLRHLQHLNYDQIASALQVPVRTVETRLYRARAALRKTLAVAADGEGGESHEVCGSPTPAGRLLGPGTGG